MTESKVTPRLNDPVLRFRAFYFAAGDTNVRFTPTYTNAGDQVPAWSRRLMEDRLRLAATPAERLDAVREHRNRMISFERLILRYTEKGAGSIVEAPKVKYYRLEADQLLAEAGVDPAKEPPVAETERNPAPRSAAPSSAPPAGPR